MFQNKKRIQVELPEDVANALSSLDGDVQALVGLVDELVATHTAILEALRNGVASAVPVDRAIALGTEEVERKRVPPPEAMASQTTFESYMNEEDRIVAPSAERAVGFICDAQFRHHRAVFEFKVIDVENLRFGARCSSEADHDCDTQKDLHAPSRELVEISFDRVSSHG